MTTTLPDIPWRRALVFLLVPALALRLLGLLLTGDDPLVRWPFGDGLGYAKWALTIAEGDVLGAGRPVFYQAPLYPYVLALLQRLGLGFWPGPQLLNFLAGGATVLFVFGLAFRLFGVRCAWIAGAVQALWGPALMMELLLDKTALGLAAGSGFAFFAVTLEARRGAGLPVPGWQYLLLGLSAGVLALLRENLLLLGLACAIWLLLRPRASALQARARPAALVLLGLFGGLLPSLAHNLAQGGELVLTSYQSGTNLWMGNHAGAEGTYEELAAGRGDALHEERDARQMAAAALGREPATVSARAVQSWFLGQVLQFAVAEPLAFAALQLRKLQYFVYHAEPPDTVPYRSFRRGRPWLLPERLLAGLLLPLALLGLCAAGPRPEQQLLRVLALVACASVVAFYVVSRYRLACLPLLVPFAAHGALQIVALARARRWRSVPLAAGPLVLLPAQLWILPTPPRGLAAHEQDALLALNRGTTLANWHTDKHAALPALRESARLAPGLLAARRALARTLLHPSVAGYAEAATELQVVVRLDPGSAESWHNLAFAQQRAGDGAAALRTLDAAERQLAALPAISERLRRELAAERVQELERGPSRAEAASASPR